MNKFNQTVMNQVNEKAYVAWLKQYGAIDDIPDELLDVATNSIIPLINKGCKKKVCIYDLEQVEELYSGSYDVNDDFRANSQLVCLNCDTAIFYKDFYTSDQMLLDVVKLVHEKKAETERSESGFPGSSSRNFGSEVMSPLKIGYNSPLKNLTTLDQDKLKIDETAKEPKAAKNTEAKDDSNYDLTSWKMKYSGIKIPDSSKFNMQEAEAFKDLVVHKLSKDKIEIIKENFIFDQLNVPLPSPQDLIVLCSEEKLTHSLNVLLVNYWRTKVIQDKYSMCSVFLFEISRVSGKFIPSDLASSDTKLVLHNPDFHKILFWMYTPFGNHLIEYDKRRRVAIHIDIFVENASTTPAERKDYALRQFDKLVSELYPGLLSVVSSDQAVKMITKNPNLAIHVFLIDYLFSASQIHLVTEINWVILWIIAGFNLIVRKQPIVIKRKPSQHQVAKENFNFQNTAHQNAAPTVVVSEEMAEKKIEKKKPRPNIIFQGGSKTRNPSPEKSPKALKRSAKPSPAPKPRKNLVLEQANVYIPEKRAGNDKGGESITHSVDPQEKLENLMPLLKFYQRNDPDRYEHLVKKAKEDSKAEISEAINMYLLQKDKEGSRKHKKSNSNHYEIKRDSIRSFVVAKESSSDKVIKSRGSKFNFLSREPSAEKKKKGLSRFAEGLKDDQNRSNNKLPMVKSSKRLISHEAEAIDLDSELPVHSFNSLAQSVLSRRTEDSGTTFIYNTEMMNTLTNEGLSKEERYEVIRLLTNQEVFESYDKVVCPLALATPEKEARYSCLVIDNKRKLIESFEPLDSHGSIQSTDSLKALSKYIRSTSKQGNSNPLYLVKKSKLDTEITAKEKTGLQVLYYIDSAISGIKADWSTKALRQFGQYLK